MRKFTAKRSNAGGGRDTKDSIRITRMRFQQGGAEREKKRTKNPEAKFKVIPNKWMAEGLKKKQVKRKGSEKEEENGDIPQTRRS